MEPQIIAADTVCHYCHQAILPSYYFCPNCGTKITSAPLSISTAAQIWLYVFSAILPMLCFLFITRWQGVKYYQSKDPATRLIGMIAIVILILSTLVTMWLAYEWTQQTIQGLNASINADLGT